MSGQLVGEVLAAADELKARGLPRNAFAALIAIAEKAGTETRQGSVPWSHIRAGIYAHNSARSAERAVEALRKAGVVTVIKKGFNNQHGRIAAPIYKIEYFTEHATIDGGSVPVDNSTEHATQSGGNGRGGEHAKIGGEHAKIGTEHATLGGVLNGSTTRPTNGGPPPVFELHCQRHRHDPDPPPCGACGRKREAAKKTSADTKAAQADERRAIDVLQSSCPRCDSDRWLVDTEGVPVEPAVQCRFPTKPADGCSLRLVATQAVAQ